MTAPLTETVTTTSTDDDAVHVVCCDPDMALCGTPVPGGNWVAVTTPTDCPLCALAEDMPCGNPDCPDRETDEEKSWHQ